MSTIKNNDRAIENEAAVQVAQKSSDRARARRRLRIATAIGAALLIPYALYGDDGRPLLDGPAVEAPAVDDQFPVGAPATVEATPVALQAQTPATQPTDDADADRADADRADDVELVDAPPATATVPPTRPADAANLFEGLPAGAPIQMLVGRSVVLRTKAPYTRISITQPEVVGDNPVDPKTILLTAKKAGASQLIVWDDKDRSQVVDIVVNVDLKMLSELIKTNFPAAQVELSAVNGTLVVKGRVQNLQTSEQITEMLAAYGKVLNFMEMAGGQQVMLQVRFAEVSRTATTALGVNFGLADGAGHFASNVPGGGGPFQVDDGVGNLTRAVGANVTLFGGGRIGSTEFDVMLSALRNNNLLRVLAEPNLATLSGKEAEFLAGGEFPIPVPQAGGSGNAAITVEYKQFGIRLVFVPIVLGDGKIRIQGTAEVSDLDFSRAVTIGGFNIPSLTKRTVTTTIELGEGQTFSLAGLLNNRVTANKQAVPLLGDIPVLGALFRSVRYERSETELVVLVTPHLVEGMNPAQVPELPGERWNHPSESDLFIRQYMGGPGADPASANKPAPSAFRGPYGFVPVPAPVRQSGAAGERVTSVQEDQRSQ